MKCIAGAKIRLFYEAPVYYNSVSENTIAEKQLVSTINHTKKVRKSFWGIKLGLILANSKIA